MPKIGKSPENCVFSGLLAEKEGFEPSRQLSHPTPLAGVMIMSQIACIYRGFDDFKLLIVISRLLVDRLSALVGRFV